MLCLRVVYHLHFLICLCLRLVRTLNILSRKWRNPGDTSSRRGPPPYCVLLSWRQTSSSGSPRQEYRQCKAIPPDRICCILKLQVKAGVYYSEFEACHWHGHSTAAVSKSTWTVGLRMRSFQLALEVLKNRNYVARRRGTP